LKSIISLILSVFELRSFEVNKQLQIILKGDGIMTAKKKKETLTQTTENVVAEQEIQPQQEPEPEIPEHQIEATPVENQIEPSPESKVEPEATPITEPKNQEESAITNLEPTSIVETPVPKPKPLTLASLHSEIEELRQIILEMQEVPVRQRKPPISNGKVQIKDTLTGKIFPSKNNCFQSLLKAHEIDDLVEKGVFGKDPARNSFGCYSLFRAYPGRFVEIQPEVKHEAGELPQEKVA
jgi:hypothetical protein